MKILLFSFLPFLLFGYIDLGRQGNLYPIKEKSILKELTKIAHTKKFKQKVKKQILEAYDKAFYVNKELIYSKIDKNITKIDYSVIHQDIYSPTTGQLLKRAGEKIIVPLPAGITQTFCLIDGKWDKNITKEILKEYNGCGFYMIANIDIRKWANKYHIHKEVYPYREDIVKRWKMDKIPIKITLWDKYVKKEYLNFYRIKKKVLNEK